MTRLNELTIDSAKAPSEPIVISAIRVPSSPFSADVVVISGVSTQVASAVKITTASEIAVFWTTESIVMGPPVATGVPGWPGAPVPQVDGSLVPAPP